MRSKHETRAFVVCNGGVRDRYKTTAERAAVPFRGRAYYPSTGRSGATVRAATAYSFTGMPVAADSLAAQVTCSVFTASA